jgi:EmrB/QacA subfamily drug resistance transporter
MDTAAASVSNTRRSLIFGAAALAVFTAAVEGTIVSTAMPTIVSDLGGLRLFSWVFALYFLTQAVSIPIYGRLSDIYGRKRVFLVGAALFLIGSLLCGFAHTMPVLVAFRTLQGIGAGGVQPVATTIVGDLYSPAERARMQGYLSSVWGFAGIIGPVLGAVLVEHVGWSAVFWINVPIVIACMTAMALFLHDRREVRSHRIDVVGSLLFVLGIGTLIVGLVMSVSLSAVTLVVLGIVAVAALAGLIVYEQRTTEPMVPIALYRHRVIGTCAAGTFMIGMLVMTCSAFLPTYLQGVLQGTVRLSGTVMGVMSVAWTLGSILGGRVMTWSTYRVSAASGGVLLVAGAAMLIALDPERGATWAMIGAALLGAGFGAANSSFLVATQASVGWEQRGAATGANLFSRQVGQAVGTAAFGAVFNLGVFGRSQPTNESLLTFDPLLAQAIALALHHIFEIGALLAIAILVLAFTLPSRLSAAQVKAA